MAKITLRPQAESDLLEIWRYIANDSVTAADRWVDDLSDRLSLWATQPMMGRARNDLVAGLRSLTFGRYVVFFKPTEDGIDVIRVLHGSRDIDAIFAE